MELSREQHLDPAKAHLTYQSNYAPVEVFAAMIALQDPEQITASCTASSGGQGGTTWRTLWLSADRLTYCTAFNAADPDWTLYLGNPMGVVEADVTAWNVPLRDVELGVSKLRAAGQSFGGGVEADAVWSVAVPGGREVTVPLFGDFAGHRGQEAAEAFVAALRSAL